MVQTKYFALQKMNMQILKVFPHRINWFFLKNWNHKSKPILQPWQDYFLFKMLCSKCTLKLPKMIGNFFLVNVFMNLILVIHHVFKIGLKPDFSVFKKITKSLPSGFFNSPWGKTFRIRILFWSAKYLVWTIPSKTFLFNPT